MNREIKFRVWNTQKHKMYYPKNAAMLFNDRSWTFDGCDDPKTLPAGWFRYGDHNDSVLQQYTGIKDKNGKEIYEGDVVQYKVKHTEGSKVTEQLEIKTIIFSNGKFSPFPEKICYPDYTDYESYDFEVIGHIFES